MADDILFLIGFLFVVLLAFTFSHAGPNADTGIFNVASTTPSTTITATNPTASSYGTQTQNQTQVQTPPAANVPSLSYFSQTSGTIGSTVTLHGSNFSLSGNVLHFGNTAFYATSNDGTAITFKVPQIQVQPCTSGSNQNCSLSEQTNQTPFGMFQVYVSNLQGISNALSFTVLSGSSAYGVSPPSVNVTGPQGLNPNDQGIWALTITTPQQTNIIVSIDWGDGTVSSRRLPVTNTQSTTFGHIYDRNGQYTISFTVTNDDAGVSAHYTLSTTVAFGAYRPQAVPPSISYLSQTYGPVGTEVVVNGAGFSASPVAIHFGTTTITHATVYNQGSTLYFNVPNLMSGNYPVYISNDLGQITNTYYFSVTNP